MYISRSQQTDELYQVYFEIQKEQSGNARPLSLRKVEEEILRWKGGQYNI